jgi:beta-glucosidase
LQPVYYTTEERNQCGRFPHRGSDGYQHRKREGDEVAQLYLAFPHVPGAPLRTLRGFKRIHLKPGQSQTIQFELKDRDLSMVTEDGTPIIAKGEYSVSIGGGQPNTKALSVVGTFQVEGTKTLPE